MFIQNLNLTNFRNYAKEKIHLTPGICIIQGANGQGKSNLLEAVYNLCFARSFKNIKDNDLVRWNTPFYFIQGKLFLQGQSYLVEIGYEAAKKRKVIKINDRLHKQLLFTTGKCPVVFFTPEDLELIRKGPEERRRFLDREISQIDTLYRDYLQRYNRVIYQKNQVLKEKRPLKKLRELTRTWNRQIIYFGSRIMQKRAQMISIWDKLSAQNYSILFQNCQSMKMHYANFLGKEITLADLQDIEKAFAEELFKVEEEEFKRGFSLIGPHRDDLLFLLDGHEAKRFASHGQQRSTIIALKAAQIQYFSQKNEKPLFIIDDIFSELDERRKKQSFSLFKDAEQVLITITKKDKNLDPCLEKLSYSALLQVENGKIIQSG